MIPDDDGTKLNPRGLALSLHPVAQLPTMCLMVGGAPSEAIKAITQTLADATESRVYKTNNKFKWRTFHSATHSGSFPPLRRPRKVGQGTAGAWGGGTKEEKKDQ